jgi:hypothetical protein
MTVRRKFALIGLALTAVFLWPFVGFDHYVGDHEIGDGWDMFMKPSPSLQLRFHNPAQLVLDIVPFDQLDNAQKEEMRRYCKIRYWVDDLVECYRLVYAARY